MPEYHTLKQPLLASSRGPTTGTTARNNAIDALITISRTSINQLSNFTNAGAMSLKVGDDHLQKRYAPKLHAGIIFDVYDQQHK